MDYVALCYVRHEGKLYGRGEIISDLPAEKAARLQEKNAIQPIGAAEEKPAAPDPSPRKEESGAEIPAAPVAEDEDTEDVDDAEDVEIEMDAMDGIVTAPKAEEALPAKAKRSSARAKGGKTK